MRSNLQKLYTKPMQDPEDPEIGNFQEFCFIILGILTIQGKWYYKAPEKADADFKLIAAHEIGHEILLAYGGHLYSKTHKGSSTLLTQQPLG